MDKKLTSDSIIKGTGALTVGVSAAVFVSLLLGHGSFNPLIASVVLGLASGAVALWTARALPSLVILVLATFPSVFDWYVFLYLPLLLLLLVGGFLHLIVRSAPESQ